MDTNRLMTQTSFSPAVGERWNMIKQGWEMVASNPWTGSEVGFLEPHSGFTKAALEFGLFFFIMFCIPYIYIIKTSYFVARYHLKPHVRLFAWGILIAGLVAVLEGLFGITLFSGGYAQVFWLFIGYLYLARREIIFDQDKIASI